MIIKLGRLQFKLYATILEKRVGICSQQYGQPNRHMLLWDFDDVDDLASIETTLIDLRIRYKLPTIYIVQSSVNKYHAYCFSARSFRETIHILTETPQIDMVYLRIGVARGYFTLRITPRKKDKPFRLVKTLASIYPAEMRVKAMTVNEYLTSNKGEI